MKRSKPVLLVPTLCVSITALTTDKTLTAAEASTTKTHAPRRPYNVIANPYVAPLPNPRIGRCPAECLSKKRTRYKAATDTGSGSRSLTHYLMNHVEKVSSQDLFQSAL